MRQKQNTPPSIKTTKYQGAGVKMRPPPLPCLTSPIARGHNRARVWDDLGRWGNLAQTTLVIFHRDSSWSILRHACILRPPFYADHSASFCSSWHACTLTYRGNIISKTICRNRTETGQWIRIKVTPASDKQLSTINNFYTSPHTPQAPITIIPLTSWPVLPCTTRLL